MAMPGLAVVEVAAADDKTAFESRSCSPRGPRSRWRTVRRRGGTVVVDLPRRIDVGTREPAS
ncbi:DUF6207 family protein [Streptomyces paradoxus]|uniref:DUF6207 family protein n=1 Tax=Streptomyces paradoxus TaxID=66375 RepID=UPI0036F6D07D